MGKVPVNLMCYFKGLEAAAACERTALAELIKGLDAAKKQHDTTLANIENEQKTCREKYNCDRVVLPGSADEAGCAICTREARQKFENEASRYENETALLRLKYHDMIKDALGGDGSLFGKSPEGSALYETRCVCCLQAYAAYNKCNTGGGLPKPPRPVPEPIDSEGAQ